MNQVSSVSGKSPFLFENDDAYRRWRAAKLADYPDRAEELLVEVADPAALSEAEYKALAARIRKTNMALYAGPPTITSKDAVRALGVRFGLSRLDSNWLADDDGITSLTVNPDGPHPGYIPYTNRAINWHTDGYYNRPDRQIHGLMLHCVRPAAEGGENALWDPELAYLMLRDEDPEYVRALMRDDAMTIPPGTDSEGGERGASVGPVFSVRPDGSLHMRYTARKRNIEWSPEPAVQAAVRRLAELLRDPPFAYRARLEAGMGLICNNVLHDRSGFSDPAEGEGRLLFRARFFDRVQLG